jgi:site-specific DNA-methyltransferase (adenine-specific)
MKVQLINADVLEGLGKFPDNHFDSCVCDPPYELGFMGKKWDSTGIAYSVEMWREVLRVLKPGAHLLAFGGSRTYHRLACAIEDGGFQIRDQLQWIFGSGFPKSLDVGKAIDKAAGAERTEKVWTDRYKDGKTRQNLGPIGNLWPHANGNEATVPATDLARQWDGWGTALKPAHEPIVVARKPPEGTIIQNVLKWGAGAINVAGCMIPVSKEDAEHTARPNLKGKISAPGGKLWVMRKYKQEHDISSGRWPANVIHDGSDEVLAEFEKSGNRPSGAMKKPYTYKNNGFSMGAPSGETRANHESNTGSAARFFYWAKSSPAERNKGLDSTYTVKYNIPKIGGVLCKGVGMVLVELLQKVMSESTVTWSIGESGESIMGQCPSGSLSTIKTLISKITTSQILNLLTPSLINDCIAGANSETESGGSLAGSAAKLSQSQPNITNGSQAELAHGVSLAVSEMLSVISDAENWKPSRNTHSTVKPLSLMTYLVRLVTPPGGLVLDCFCGSGSTLIAAAKEGFDSVGIDKEAAYVEMSQKRIAGEMGMLCEVSIED